MNTASVASNPFALMMNPESVFAAMASSERLARLHSRVFRPLDKPLIAKTDGDAAADFDALIDGTDSDDAS